MLPADKLAECWAFPSAAGARLQRPPAGRSGRWPAGGRPGTGAGPTRAPTASFRGKVATAALSTEWTPGSAMPPATPLPIPLATGVPMEAAMVTKRRSVHGATHFWKTSYCEHRPFLTSYGNYPICSTRLLRTHALETLLFL